MLPCMEIDAELLARLVELQNRPPVRTDRQLANSRYELRERWIDDELFELSVWDTQLEQLINRTVLREP